MPAPWLWITLPDVEEILKLAAEMFCAIVTVPVAFTSKAPVTVVAPSVVVLLAPVTFVVRLPVEPETLKLPKLLSVVAPPAVTAAVKVPVVLLSVT